MNAALTVRSLLPLVLLASCAGGARWRATDAGEAEKLEIQVDDFGRATEIEYHLLPSAVPRVVHEAMDRLHPGGAATAAEKEYEGDTLYWELTKTIGPHKVEAMFLPDGTLHSEEVEVAAASVPQEIRDAVDTARWGAVDDWEEIRDGSRKLVEYHVKTTRDGRHYKLLLGLDGSLLAAFREVVAEIEVPVE